MQFARELFVDGVTSASLLADEKKTAVLVDLAGRSGVVGFVAPGGRPPKPDPEKSQRKRQTRKKWIEDNIAVVWFCVVLVAVILSAIALLASRSMFGEYRPGVIFATLAWDFVIGGFILFIASAKTVTALAGLLFGSGASDLTGAKGAVTRMDEMAQVAVAKLGFLEASDGSDAGFVTAMVWLFLSLLFLLCLVAFKKD